MRCDITGGVCGTWSLSPMSSCNVCCPGLKRDFCLGLAGAEMQMIEIVGNGLIEWGQLGVDQEVMVT